MKTLHGNPSEIWTLAFAPDGAAVITGSKDGTVRRWPINPARKETFYEGNWMPLRFSSNGETLAAIDDDSKVVVLNLQTGEPETQLQPSKTPFGLLSPAISEDLRVLVEPVAAGFRVGFTNDAVSSCRQSGQRQITGRRFLRRRKLRCDRQAGFSFVVELAGDIRTAVAAPWESRALSVTARWSSLSSTSRSNAGKQNTDSRGGVLTDVAYSVFAALALSHDGSVLPLALRRSTIRKMQSVFGTPKPENCSVFAGDTLKESVGWRLRRREKPSRPSAMTRCASGTFARSKNFSQSNNWLIP